MKEDKSIYIYITMSLHEHKELCVQSPLHTESISIS